MKDINIGKVIMQKRREKGMTQEELAAFIGVSKASVSKWETGQSYPDITFLPVLANLFNISIDELMGYEPQMERDDIRKLYLKLSADFASQPFDEVLSRCRDIARKYYSCFPLLFHIGALLVNHSMLADDGAKTASVLEEARKLFVRVKEESDDAELVQLALYMEALCALMLGNPEEVIDLLEGTERRIASPESLLASAYRMLGKTKEARYTLQVGIFQYLVAIFNLMTDYLSLCALDQHGFEETFNRAMRIADAFNMEKIHPSLLFRLYICAAQGYAMAGDHERALDVLEKYTVLATGDIYPLELKGDEYFNMIDKWIEELDLGSSPPRSEKVIQRSIADAVTGNPAFASLANEPRFQRVLERLSSGLQDEQAYTGK